MQPRLSNSDPATRAAYEGGVFARIRREAEAERERKRQEAAARKPLSAAVFVDEDVSRDSVEAGALAHLMETAADREAGERAMREYARTVLRQRYGAIYWLLQELADPALADTPRCRQPSLPPPVGDGRDWCRRPKKRSRRTPATRRRFDFAQMAPFPGWPAAA